MNRCRVTRVQVHMSSTCSLSHSEKCQTLLEEQHWGDKDTQPLPVLLHYNSIRTCLARKVKHPQHKLVGVCFTSRYRILFGHTCGKGFHFERLSFGSFICDMLSETGNENVIQIIQICCRHTQTLSLVLSLTGVTAAFTSPLVAKMTPFSLHPFNHILSFSFSTFSMNSSYRCCLCSRGLSGF